MTSVIKATGRYLPDYIVTNDALSTIIDTSDEWIKTRTGICERRISLNENTSDLAIKAAKNIIKNGNIESKDIELIIVATITPDYTMPSTACLVQAGIGAENAFAFDVTAACSGFVYALSIADKYVNAGICKNALIIGAETISKTIDWEDRATCVLFGDGAAGVYIELGVSGGIQGEELGSDGNGAMGLTAGKIGISNAFNNQAKELASFIQMEGRAIFKFATRRLPQSLMKILEDNNINKEMIQHIVLHQANERIIQVVAKKIDVPIEKFYMNMSKYGNTSSASIPIALDEMNEQGMLKAGDKVLIAGFGGGLTWGTMLIEW